MKFNDGDRVIVRKFECPYSPDLVGFYGHVQGFYDSASDFVPVVLRGCIADAPDHDHLEEVVESCKQKPFPFHDWELEHAD